MYFDRGWPFGVFSSLFFSDIYYFPPYSIIFFYFMFYLFYLGYVHHVTTTGPQGDPSKCDHLSINQFGELLLPPCCDPAVGRYVQNEVARK